MRRELAGNPTRLGLPRLLPRARCPHTGGTRTHPAPRRGWRAASVGLRARHCHLPVAFSAPAGAAPGLACGTSAKPPGSGLRVTRGTAWCPHPQTAPLPACSPPGQVCGVPAPGPSDVTFPPFPSHFHVLLHVAVVRGPWVNCCVSAPKEGSSAIFSLVR